MFKTVIKTTTNLVKWSDKKAAESRKAMSLAMSKASFELMQNAKRDLKTGKLGLKRLSYMSDQADPRFKQKKYRKNVRSRQRQDKAPLTGLFKGITYYVDRVRLKAEVGFRGVGGTAWQARLAKKSFEGYRWTYTDELKAVLHKGGIHLRPTTQAGRVPDRDIMGAVSDKYMNKYLAKINALYLRRMSGERI